MTTSADLAYLTDLTPYATLASPTFTGTVTIPTVSAADNSTKAASTAYVDTADALKANLAGPTFTGSVVVPNQSAADNSTKAANTAYVDAAAALKLSLAGGTLSGALLAGTDGGVTIGGNAASRFNIRAYAFDSGAEGISPGQWKWGGASANGFNIQAALLSMGASVIVRWSAGDPSAVGCDIGLYRNAAGLLEVNSSVAGTFRDLKLRDIYINGATYLARTSAALTDSAAAQTATMTNAPVAGNPTKWIAIDDNGTSRKIPCW